MLVDAIILITMSFDLFFVDSDFPFDQNVLISGVRQRLILREMVGGGLDIVMRRSAWHETATKQVLTALVHLFSASMM